MLDHFAECVKQAKGVRQQAVQLNIFTAVLSALKVFTWKHHRFSELQFYLMPLTRQAFLDYCDV